MPKKLWVACITLLLSSLFVCLVIPIHHRGSPSQTTKTSVSPVAVVRARPKPGSRGTAVLVLGQTTAEEGSGLLCWRAWRFLSSHPRKFRVVALSFRSLCDRFRKAGECAESHYTIIAVDFASRYCISRENST